MTFADTDSRVGPRAQSMQVQTRSYQSQSVQQYQPASASVSAPAAIAGSKDKQTGWLGLYDDYIEKNAGNVTQIESALRSLTYIIPGRFRDAEIASESLHSGIQLLSMYHDSLLSRAVAHIPSSSSSSSPASSSARAAPAPSLHSRYTRHWTKRSPFYRRIATLLQMATYVQLLCEMVAKRRGGDRLRWKVVVGVEVVKAVCRFLLLQITRSRSLVTPALPERPQLPQQDDGDDDGGAALRELMGEETLDDLLGKPPAPKNPLATAWQMPRTGMCMPPLPNGRDISSYLVGRVLSADDIKPASTLLNQLRGSGHVAELMHIAAPLAYALLTAYVARRQPRSRAAQWAPWVAGVALEIAARQLRQRSLGTPQLERDEWTKRGWAMIWWGMRGAFYEGVTKGVVEGVKKKMPAMVAGILADYEYLWENYHFSTTVF
ncbi:hypothetical protein TD95_002560 [Thielaviopsis punctulata]|uniref:Peroxisomal membrane protein PEX16 n=1 Tax=Thielaviopsis punctulata TaxID=72032 RepID=A0A0F4ZLP9_9PEZI|nr:hypothetical protein TD95_002560 [Thielaviopsis punctulata]